MQSKPLVHLRVENNRWVVDSLNIEAVNFKPLSDLTTLRVFCPDIEEQIWGAAPNDANAYLGARGPVNPHCCVRDTAVMFCQIDQSQYQRALSIEEQIRDGLAVSPGGEGD